MVPYPATTHPYKLKGNKENTPHNTPDPQMRIPAEFINTLLERTDIVDLIHSYVPLKHTGKDYQALCPFHQEKTPSFTVSRNKQFYYCFGCEAKGNAISFLMQYRNLQFLEAVEELAHKSGMAMPATTGDPATTAHNNQQKKLYELLEEVARWFAQQLTEHQAAQGYLQQRGLDKDTCTRFQLGYAPGGNVLLQRFRNRQELLQEVHLIKTDGSRRYDSFRQRLMFPIRDRRGRVIGFGGRVLDDNKVPKYLNSSESSVFHKKRELYGLRQAMEERKLSSMYIVEGYMDVLALAQHGVRNAVATMGTAITREQMIALFRVCDTLVFCFDRDTAGEKASQRALVEALPLLQDGREVLFRFLPQGSDPDSYLRAHGSDSFHQHDDCLPLSAYMQQLLQQGLSLHSTEQKAKLLKRAAPWFNALPASTFKQSLLNELVRLTSLDQQSVAQRMQQIPVTTRPGSGTNTGSTILSRERRLIPPSALTQALQAILRRPDILLQVNEQQLQSIHLPGIEVIQQMAQFVQQHPECSPAQLLADCQHPRYAARLKELASADFDRHGSEAEQQGQAEPLGILQWALTQMQAETERARIVPLKQKLPSELTEEEKELLLSSVKK